MFLVKRICKTKRENLWEVASLLNKICGEYEDKGRSEATIYISGFSTPAKEYSVTAEWKQESLKPLEFKDVPSQIKSKLSSKLMSMIDFYEIEFHEIVTEKKLAQRNL